MVDSRMMTIRSARMSREDVVLEGITVCDKICRRGDQALSGTARMQTRSEGGDCNIKGSEDAIAARSQRS